MNNKISVLIPAYNTGRYIAECIESIISQTYRNLEIIIVDDGSTDETIEIAERYALNDSRINVVAISHEGVSHARNVCMSHATGEYILFVDSDDWIGDNLCYNLLVSATRNDADIVFSSMIIVPDCGDPYIFGDRSGLFKDTEVLSGKDCFIKMVEIGDTYPMVAGNLYKKCLIERNELLFEGQYHEDEYFTPQLLKYAQRVCNLRKPSYFYRQHRDSIMHDEANKRSRVIALGELAETIKSLLLKDSTGQDYNRQYFQAVYKHVQSLQMRAKALFDDCIIDDKRSLLLIFIDQCMGAQYGLGTYVRELVLSQKETSSNVVIVELCATGNDNILFGSLHHQLCIKFPYKNSSNYNGDTSRWILYQKGVSFYLANKFGLYHDVICHFNTFGYDVIAKELKEKLNAKIVFTLHYTDWSFKLLGNKGDLIRRLQADDSETDSICISFNKEKAFLHDCCDHIIAIAEHSRRMLSDLYHVPEKKVSLVYNGISTRSDKQIRSRAVLRNKYGFRETDKIIIFAGRIEKVKGIHELVRAFKILCNTDADARLIVAGTGAFSSVLEESNPVWNKMVFTGFVSQEDLFNLYRISDIGVVPSLHEEFGYVALEMASSGLPVLVNNTGGLHELSKKVPLITLIRSSIYDPLQFAHELADSLSQKPTECLTPHDCNRYLFDSDGDFQKYINKIYDYLRTNSIGDKKTTNCDYICG